VQSPADRVMNSLMHHAPWIAVGLLLISVACWVYSHVSMFSQRRIGVQVIQEMLKPLHELRHM